MLALSVMALAGVGVANLPPRFTVKCTCKEMVELSLRPGDVSIKDFEFTLKVDLTDNLYSPIRVKSGPRSRGLVTERTPCSLKLSIARHMRAFLILPG